MTPLIWGIENSQSHRSRKSNSCYQGPGRGGQEAGRGRRGGLFNGYSFCYARWITSGDLPYNVVAIVNNTVLFTYNFVKKMDLILSVLSMIKKKKKKWEKKRTKFSLRIQDARTCAIVQMGPEQLAMRLFSSWGTRGRWGVEGEGLIGHNHKKYYVYLQRALRRKLVGKFFFACLKPWSSKNSAISAADRNSWKFWARHFSWGHLQNIPSSVHISRHSSKRKEK